MEVLEAQLSSLLEDVIYESPHLVWISLTIDIWLAASSCPSAASDRKA